METNEQIQTEIDKIDKRIATLKRRILWLSAINWVLLIANLGFLVYHCNMVMVEAYTHKLEWQRVALLALQAFATGFIACKVTEDTIRCSTK